MIFLQVIKNIKLLMVMCVSNYLEYWKMQIPRGLKMQYIIVKKIYYFRCTFTIEYWFVLFFNILIS